MKATKLLLTLISLVFLLLLATSCDGYNRFVDGKHVHEYGTQWIYDEGNHWKTCTKSECGEATEKAAHSFGEPAVTEAQIGKEGSKVYTCTVCSGTKTEIIPALEHSHDVSNDWISNENEHWNICSGCDAKLNKTVHVWDSGTVIVEATSGKTGTFRYRCIVCDRTKDEIIPALPEKMGEHDWIARFALNNVRVDSICYIDGFGSTEMITLIDGAYAEITTDGETYITDSATAKSELDFSDYYDYFNHVGDNVYYASLIPMDSDDYSAELSDVTIIFNGGIIESISYSMEFIGMICEFDYTFSEWGSVFVEMPTLSDEEYAMVLDRENFDTYTLDVIIYSPDGEFMGYTLEFFGNNYIYTYYISEDEFETIESYQQMAGIVLNEAYSMLCNISASDYVYDALTGSFVLPDPTTLNEELSYFSVVIEDGYLVEVYTVYEDGSEITYYHSAYGNAEIPDLSEEEYAAALDYNNFYRYSYGIVILDPTYGATYYTYVFDGDNYTMIKSDSQGSVTRDGVVENAGIELNFMVSLLAKLNASDFEYDSDLAAYKHTDPDAVKSGLKCLEITFEDGYLSTVYAEYAWGYSETYYFYSYASNYK